MKQPGRLWAVDALRGLALLNMLVYHGMYDWVYVCLLYTSPSPRDS